MSKSYNSVSFAERGIIWIRIRFELFVFDLTWKYLLIAGDNVALKPMHSQKSIDLLDSVPLFSYSLGSLAFSLKILVLRYLFLKIFQVFPSVSQELAERVDNSTS